MHNYSTDTQRYFFLIYMGIMSGLLALAFDPLVNSTIIPAIANILPAWIGEAVREQTFLITAMTVLSIIFPVYNGFAWRYLSDLTSFEGIPNLQGYWVQIPAGTSINDAPEVRRDPDGTLELLEDHGQLLIGQNWIELEAGYVDLDSEYWRSDSAMLLTDDAPDPELIFTYQSESLSQAPTDATRGTVRLRYLDREGSDRLVGYHYTDASNSRERLEFVRRTNPLIPYLLSEVDEPDT